MRMLGDYALILALALSIFGTLSAFIAALKARERFRQVALRCFLGATTLVLVAAICLWYLLLIDDFTTAYVHRFSNATLPQVFKFTALWAGTEGSLLFWSLILTGYVSFFIYRTRKAPRLMMSWAHVFIGMALVFFLTVNNVVANPFEIWADVSNPADPVPFMPRDGNGLNPQLQHWAMIIHPPLLYAGYIAFLIPFAVALGALITRMESREWIRMIRGWTLGAWLILGIGIVLGGAWAYMELGWGGYWAWDPVENASFMPWLLGTAFLHSVMVQETRGMFKKWNIILVVATYLMCMLGTFITRSGLISSVHAFAKSDIGLYFIVYIVVNLIAALFIFVIRRDHLKDDNRYTSSTSRETGLLFNNVLLVAISFTMLLATIYPMLTEAVYGTKRELRHGFYNTVEIPIFLGLMLLMAAGPILTWKRTSKTTILRRFRWPLVGMIVAGVTAFILNDVSHTATISIAIFSFLLVTIIEEFATTARRRAKRSGEGLLTAVRSVCRMNHRRYGGYIVHFSMFVIGIGLTGAAFNREAKSELGVGEVLKMGRYHFQIAAIGERRERNYAALTADVNLLIDGKVVKSFQPEQRFYHASESNASEVSIRSSLLRDYYVVLAGTGEGHTREHPVSVFHIYVNPLVIWVWIGSIIMVLGTIYCMLGDALPQRAKARVLDMGPEMESA